MKMTVLGLEKVDYTSKKTGEPVKGITLHCSCRDQNVIGYRAESVFVSDRLDCFRDLTILQPGAVINVEYNRRGYVADVEVISEQAEEEALASKGKGNASASKSS